MKIKHGILKAKMRSVLAGFAVLLLAATFTLTSCGDDESGDPSSPSGGPTYTLIVSTEYAAAPTSVTKGKTYYLMLQEGSSGGIQTPIPRSSWTVALDGTYAGNTKVYPYTPEELSYCLDVDAAETASSIKLDATVDGKVVVTVSRSVTD